MFEYLYDTFQYLIPALVFAVLVLIISTICIALMKQRFSIEHIPSIASGFMASYLSSLGGVYSVWPSFLILFILVAFVKLSTNAEFDLKSLFEDHKWSALLFSVVYVVCTNYFLRAFNPVTQ